MPSDVNQNIIIDLSRIQTPSANDLLSIQRKYAKLNKSKFIEKDKLVKLYHEMVNNNTIAQNEELLNVLRMKNTRSNSGIASISVLTKANPCSGSCIYCPNEESVPKSYLSSEPAVMRAIACGYHPYKQVKMRIGALRATGHVTNKISMRIVGGTWSDYNKQYQTWFVKELFRACNSYGKITDDKKFSLSKYQKINETAENRIVELSIETRQDKINFQELMRMRKLGITKVELGVQSTDEEVLRDNNRNICNQQTEIATKLLKDFGFKVSFQMMLNLYKSSPQKDINSFNKIFIDNRYRPDHLKIYPLALVKNCELYQKYLQGSFKPYSEIDLIKIISEIKSTIPYYCRVERVIRDIPAEKIVCGGAKISNLRQKIHYYMDNNNLKCDCIRCREIKNNKLSVHPKIHVLHYVASGCDEYFISMESQDRKYIIGFCRLRLNKIMIPLSNIKYAMIREIHVYGTTLDFGKKSKKAYQHIGYGKRMLNIAESIARCKGYHLIMVIAGVGVRMYFKKFGYRLKNSYMIKSL